MKTLYSVPNRNLDRLIPARRRQQRKGWLTAAFVLLGASLYAQTPPSSAGLLAPASAQEMVPAKLDAEELDQLLAPIALYPDALIALILPASTVPSDVVLGARYVQANGDPNQVDNQPWDDSVKSLVRYPDVLQWMDKNLEWTSSVGEAFVDQPADVMNEIQKLRAEAKAKGNLVDTPQQKVVEEEKVIRIIPADPEVIYVPQYDPEVVYVQSYSPGIAPLLTFGAGFAVGAWLNYDFDWGNQCFYRGNWNNNGWNHYNHGWNNNGWNNNGWNNGGGGNNSNVNNNTNNVNVTNITNVSRWQPSAKSRPQLARRERNNGGNARFVNAAPANRHNRPNAGQGAGDLATANSSGAVAVDRHHNQLPKPSRINVTHRGQMTNPTNASGQPRNGSQISPGAAQVPPAPGSTTVDRTPATTPDTVTANGHRNHRNNNGVVAPTTAPQVSGQLPGSVSGKPDKSSRHDREAGKVNSAPQSPSVAPAPGNTPAKVDRHHNAPAQPTEAAPRNAPPSEAPRHSQPQTTAPSQAPRHAAPQSAAPNEAPRHSSANQHQSPAPKSSHREHASSAPTQAAPQHERHQSAPQTEQRSNNKPAREQHNASSASSSHPAPSHNSAPSKSGGNNKKNDKKKDKDHS